MSPDNSDIDSQMDDAYDPFKGDTGLKENYDGTIVDAWFGTDSNYNDGNTLLAYMKVAADDGEEVELRYPCGPDWGSFDGGETAEHPRGESKGFSTNVAYYQFFAEALNVGADEELRGRSKGVGGGKGPRAAVIWKGLRFHFDLHRETKKFKDRTSGEMVEREVVRTLPTAFLGTGEGGQVANPSGAATQTAAPTPTSAPVASDPAASDPFAGLPAGIRERAVELARSQDYKTWVDSMLELDGVVSSATLVMQLGNDALYNQLKG